MSHESVIRELLELLSGSLSDERFRAASDFNRIAGRSRELVRSITTPVDQQLGASDVLLEPRHKSKPYKSREMLARRRAWYGHLPVTVGLRLGRVKYPQFGNALYWGVAYWGHRGLDEGRVKEILVPGSAYVQALEPGHEPLGDVKPLLFGRFRLIHPTELEQLSLAELQQRYLDDITEYYAATIANREAATELARLYGRDFAELPLDGVVVPSQPGELAGGEAETDGLDAVPFSDYLRSHLEECPTVVLQGPPGTGKTHQALQLVRAMVDSDDELRDCRWSNISSAARRWRTCLDGRLAQKPVVWDIVQLHPGYAYEDFVRGIQAGVEPNSTSSSLAFQSVDQVIVQLAEVARHIGPGTPVILILDEINRCNLAAVLGELILILEKSKRLAQKEGGSSADVDDPDSWEDLAEWDLATGTAVRLQYPPPIGDDSAWTLMLPENLWIVGTMNTADRSIAMVDYAIRRRFRFIDVLPDSDAVLSFYERQSTASSSHSRAAFRLFEELAGEAAGLPERLMVGHSYFMEAVQPRDSRASWSLRLARRLVYEVVPLLREYFAEGLLRTDVISIAGVLIPLSTHGDVSAEDSAARVSAWIQSHFETEASRPEGERSE